MPVVNHSPPTSASAAGSTAIGQALQSAAIDIEPIDVVPQQQLQPPVAVVTADVTELRHKAAAERLEKDEYLNYCAISSCLEFVDEMPDTVHEFSENSKPVNIKDRLRSHIQFWQFILAPQFIIDTILTGYIIPFLTTPLIISEITSQLLLTVTLLKVLLLK